LSGAPDKPTSDLQPLPHPPASGGTPCHEAIVVNSSVFERQGDVARAAYKAPSACLSGRPQIVLKVAARSAGLQDDRQGAVWLSGVEILRGATPSCSDNGFELAIEKDVSDYAPLFVHDGELMVQFSNGATWAHGLHVSVSVVVYAGEGASPSLQSVLPLSNAASHTDPLEAMKVSGSAGLSSKVSLPPSTMRARLDVYASARLCEEAWYMNELDGPDCGGGASRELRVLVDGTFAGAQYPYPILYSGTVSTPMMTPLSGILALDTPAYHFDLTPWLGLLTDGQEHTVTVQVGGATESGDWLLGGLLVLERSKDLTIVRGSVSVDAPEPSVQEWLEGAADPIGQYMRAERGYLARGELVLSDQTTLVSQVCGKLTGWSRNWRYLARTETGGAWSSRVSSTYSGRRVTVESTFSIDDLSLEVQVDEFSRRMSAKADFSGRVLASYDGVADGAACDGAIADGAMAIELKNRLESQASYEFGPGSEMRQRRSRGTRDFEILLGGEKCFARELGVVDGVMTRDEGSDACDWQLDTAYACGLDICGFEEAPGARPGRMAQAPRVFKLKATRMSASAGNATLPPLRGPSAALMRRAETALAERTWKQRRLSGADLMV